MKKPKKSETWDDCRPDFENKTYTKKEIMKLWDVWADHIEKWGKDTWPKKEFTFIINNYEARIKTMNAELWRYYLAQNLMEERLKKDETT